MKILFLTNIPSPYRVRFFNELGKHCELTVLFETDSSTERDASWKEHSFQNFEGILLPGKRTGMDTAFCPSVVRYLRRGRYDYVIVTVLASLTGLLAVTWLKLLQIPYLYEGDGGIPKNTRGLKAALKQYVIGSAKLCFSTSAQFDRYCIAYGASPERIRRYPFTSVCAGDILEEVPSQEQKAALRRQLGIREEHFILSVGRILPLKGYDILLNAFAERREPSWGLYIIGGRIREEFQQIVTEKQLDQVHFIDFQLPEKLRQYYMASDFFVLPTRYDPWGLVVNEAMASGLPVITTYACGAGTEMVLPGENGFLYEAEDTQELSRLLSSLMKAPLDRQRMGAAALQTAQKYTIEEMSEAHLRVLAKE